MRGGQLDSVNSLFKVAELLDQHQEVLDAPSGVIPHLNFYSYLPPTYRISWITPGVNARVPDTLSPLVCYQKQGIKVILIHPWN